MKEKGQVNRQKIIDAANVLFYHRGYNQTSFSEIADEAKIPRGNFYYYFKSKDDILAAVIEDRSRRITAMLDDWERKNDDPKARLKQLMQMLINTRKDVVRYGCPMGSLSAELGKTRPDLQAHVAEMFRLFREFLRRQFVALGYKDDAQQRAMHLLALGQGIAMMSSVYKDGDFLEHESRRVEEWIDAL